MSPETKTPTPSGHAPRTQAGELNEEQLDKVGGGAKIVGGEPKPVPPPPSPVPIPYPNVT
jgi:hypothetical protein